MRRSHSFRDWEIERLILNESNLDSDHTPRESLQSKIEEITQSNETILKKYPKELVVRSILKKAKKERPKTEIRGFFQYRVAALAACVGVIWFSFDISSHPGQIRTKGLQDYLNIYRKTEHAIEKLKPGSKVRAHDLLQISYVSTGNQFGCIFSVDSAQHVTIHYPYPEVSKQAEILEPSKEVALPSSYELDQLPGPETFYFVTSTHPFAVDSVIEQVKSSRLPTHFRLYEIKVNK
jgi:hypothetical protein